MSKSCIKQISQKKTLISRSLSKPEFTHKKSSFSMHTHTRPFFFSSIVSYNFFDVFNLTSVCLARTNEKNFTLLYWTPVASSRARAIKKMVKIKKKKHKNGQTKIDRKNIYTAQMNHWICVYVTNAQLP